MKQRLGEKKTRAVARALAVYLGDEVAVARAYVRGGWGHYWAEAWVDKSMAFMVNYRTGEVKALSDSERMVYGDYEKWAARFPKISADATEAARRAAAGRDPRAERAEIA